MSSSKENVGDYTKLSMQPEVYHPPLGGDLEVVPTPNEPQFHPTPEPDEKTPYNSPENPPARRRICGVRPLIFWILILVIVLILAAALGAGLGAGLSKKNSNDEAADSGISTTTIPENDDPESTSRPTASAAHTTSTSTPSGDDVSCPANDSLVYTPPSHTSSSTAYFLNSTTLTYTIHCNKTYFQSSDISDVQYIPNSNLSSCIQACSVYNIQWPDGGGEYGFYNLCSGITVTAGGVCQLKQGVENDAAGVNKTGGTSGQSAKLLWFDDD